MVKERSCPEADEGQGHGEFRMREPPPDLEHQELSIRILGLKRDLEMVIDTLEIFNEVNYSTELTIKIMDLTFIGLMEKNTTNDEPDEAIDN